MLETGEYRGEFDALRVDQGHGGSLLGRTSGTGGVGLASVLGRERAGVVIVRRATRSRSKQVLMRRKAGTLVGLEHVVSPTIGVDQIQVGLHGAVGIIDIPKCSLFRTRLTIRIAPYAFSAVHLADTAAVEITHVEEGVVFVPEVVADTEGD